MKQTIKRIFRENFNISPEKIREKLIQLGIVDAPCPNTIAKYLPTNKKPPSEKQRMSWLTFLRIHAPHMWGMDFFTVPTLFFRTLYVLVIINHGSRKLEHFAVTTNPTAAWTKQQIREATPFDHQPKYLLHDQDNIFTAKEVQDFLAASGITPKITSRKSP